MRTLSTTMLACAMALASLHTAATAAPPPSIMDATPDYTIQPWMTIRGTNFGTLMPAVTLDGVPLQVVAHTNTQVVALVPITTLPGSYVLTLNSPPSQSDAEFVVTLGAVGPKGDTGAAGGVGAQGPKGDTGATGSVGPQGPQVDTGASGAQGLPGSPGPQGAPGAQGPQGTTGPQAPQGSTGAQGPSGATGPQGPEGPAGTTGQNVFNPAVGFASLPNTSSPITVATQSGITIASSDVLVIAYNLVIRNSNVAGVVCTVISNAALDGSGARTNRNSNPAGSWGGRPDGRLLSISACSHRDSPGVDILFERGCRCHRVGGRDVRLDAYGKGSQALTAGLTDPAHV